MSERWRRALSAVHFTVISSISHKKTGWHACKHVTLVAGSRSWRGGKKDRKSCFKVINIHARTHTHTHTKAFVLNLVCIFWGVFRRTVRECLSNCLLRKTQLLFCDAGTLSWPQTLWIKQGFTLWHTKKLIERELAVYIISPTYWYRCIYFLQPINSHPYPSYSAKLCVCTQPLSQHITVAAHYS